MRSAERCRQSPPGLCLCHTQVPKVWAVSGFLLQLLTIWQHRHRAALGGVWGSKNPWKMSLFFSWPDQAGLAWGVLLLPTLCAAVLRLVGVWPASGLGFVCPACTAGAEACTSPHSQLPPRHVLT